MKTSQLTNEVVKAIFILFGILPLIGLVLFGALPAFSAMQFEVSWIAIDIILGAVIFLSYLVIGSVSKNRTRYPHKKIYA